MDSLKINVGPHKPLEELIKELVMSRICVFCDCLPPPLSSQLQFTLHKNDWPQSHHFCTSFPCFWLAAQVKERGPVSGLDLAWSSWVKLSSSRNQQFAGCGFIVDSLASVSVLCLNPPLSSCIHVSSSSVKAVHVEVTSYG